MSVYVAHFKACPNKQACDGDDCRWCEARAEQMASSRGHDAGAVSVRAIGTVALVLGVVFVFIAFGWWLWLLAWTAVSIALGVVVGALIGARANERGHEFDRDLTHIPSLRGDS